MINTDNLINDLDRQQIIRSYSNISYRGEYNADQDIEGYVAFLEEVAKRIEELASNDRERQASQAIFDRLHKSYLEKKQAMISANSRCLSSAIIGGANFPVAKAERANKVAYDRLCDICEFYDNYEKYIKKAFSKLYSNAEKRDTDLENMRTKLKNCEKSHELMKNINKLIRKKDIEGAKNLLRNIPNGEELINECFNPIFGKPGFASYQLSLNLAEIKRIKQRIKELEYKSDKENVINNYTNHTVIRNFDEDRLQITFDGKPSEEVRTLLKRNGFRWSPKNKTWQRKLTVNAVSAYKYRVHADLIKLLET